MEFSTLLKKVVVTMSKELNLKSLFIGSKGENENLYKELLSNLIDDHIGWRKNYMPQDLAMISSADKREESFKLTVDKVKDVLDEASRRMRSTAVPWHSAGRFWGHMNSETLLPAILGYNFSMLWNGNNCAYESSPATSAMEEDVGIDFSHMCGYGEIGWGHLTGGGTAANIEGIWYARNIKSIPLALKKVLPETVAGKSEWELLNMPTDEVMDIVDAHPQSIDAIKAVSARSGKDIQKLGKWLVPKTKHYSWPKAADMVGVGLDQLVMVDVDSHYRLKMDKLEETIRELAAQQIPVMGVVGVVGSTEEGAVDPIHEIVALRKKLYKELGVYFYIHVDAAYGSYARTLFLDENYNFIPYEKLDEEFKKHGVFQSPVHIKREVYEAYKAFGEAESITVDPHKMGYVPYAAGGVVIKRRSMRELIGYFAAYVNEKGAPSLLGAYMLEGSKAGATAVAVWVAHRVLGLNVSGYGRLIGASIESARNFYDFLGTLTFEVNGKKIRVHQLVDPDFNMVDYVFQQDGATLEETNELNRQFWLATSSGRESLYTQGFITSHTDFARPDYGDSPFDEFVNKKLGYSREEWEKAGKVTVLRACCLTPYMNDKKAFEYFSEEIKKAMVKALTAIVK